MNVVLSPFHQTLKFIMGEGGGWGGGSWERKQYEHCVISPSPNREVYNGEGVLGEEAI